MTKQLILKDLSKLVQKYTPKQGVLIQSLPQDEIFEYPKSDTTVLYKVRGFDVPIVEKTPAQAPPLPLSLLMDLKKYLKDSKSKEIINQYIEQTKQQQLEYKAPIRPLEEEKQKALNTIEKEKTKKAIVGNNQKAIEEKPSTAMGKEKALEDMTEIELREYILRKDILISDREKAIKLYKKLQQQLPKESKEKPKEKSNVIVLGQLEEAPTKQELEVQIEDAIQESKAVKEGNLTKTDEEDIKKIKDEILEVVNTINNKRLGYELQTKPIIAFKTYDDFLEYKKKVMPYKEEWVKKGLGKPNFFTTAINNLEKTVKDNLGIARKMTDAEIKRKLKKEKEAEEKKAKAEEKKAKAVAKKAEALLAKKQAEEEKKRQEELQAEEERQIKLQKEKEEEEAKKKAEKKAKKKAKATAEAKPE
jgi:hypothetical protein